MRLRTLLEANRSSGPIVELEQIRWFASSPVRLYSELQSSRHSNALSNRDSRIENPLGSISAAAAALTGCAGRLRRRACQSAVYASLEACPNMERNGPGGLRVGRLTKRSAGHIGTHEGQVGAIEQVEDLSPGFNLHRLAEEPGSGEELGDIEVDIVVSRLVVGVSAQIAFDAQRRPRELRGSG